MGRDSFQRLAGVSYHNLEGFDLELGESMPWHVGRAAKVVNRKNIRMVRRRFRVVFGAEMKSGISISDKIQRVIRTLL
jgi:hypothetical protein